MKARLIKTGSTLKLLFISGTSRIVDEDIAWRFFLNPGSFIKEDIAANPYVKPSFLAQQGGITLAYVSDLDELVIKDISFFRDIIIEKKFDFLTIDEYALLHGKKRSIIVRLCESNRLPGALKKGSMWFIPNDTPYPSDARMRPRLKSNE